MVACHVLKQKHYLKIMVTFSSGITTITYNSCFENVSYRESKGKYVLTAKGHGKCHHLLLIDEYGKVNVILSTKKRVIELLQ